MSYPLSSEELSARITSHQDAAMKDWGDRNMSWALLVSEESLQQWYLDTGGEVIDRRGQTVRLRCWTRGDPIKPLVEAVCSAVEQDVTLQLLCVHEPIDGTARTHDLGGGASVTVRDFRETYPVLHLGTHRMRWPAVSDSPGNGAEG